MDNSVEKNVRGCAFLTLIQPNPPASPKNTEEMSFPKNYCWQTKRPNLWECQIFINPFFKSSVSHNRVALSHIADGLTVGSRNTEILNLEIIFVNYQQYRNKNLIGVYSLFSDFIGAHLSCRTRRQPLRVCYGQNNSTKISKLPE